MRDAGGGGAVVNIASISSFIAQPGFVPYSTSKGEIGGKRLGRESAGLAALQLTESAPAASLQSGAREAGASCPLGGTPDDRSAASSLQCGNEHADTPPQRW